MENKQPAKAKEPSFADVYLKTFISNNKHCKVNIDGDVLTIERPWGNDGNRLIYNVSEIDELKDLNNIMFYPKFDAIIHNDLNVIEFLFGFLNPDDTYAKDYIDRQFIVHHDDCEYKCIYEQSTERVFKIARHYKRFPTESGHVAATQLIAFRDFQQKDELPERLRKYFENKAPRSFFIKPPIPVKKMDLEILSRNINLVASYYDRLAPQIVIRKLEEDTKEKKYEPVRYKDEAFPEKIAIHNVDEIVLRLIEVAQESEPRYSFLYYYQVFEYVGFNFIDEKAKKSLRQFLRDPAIINCAEDRIAELFSQITDLQHHDDVKMKRVIEEYCDPVVIWKEIENDLEFFSSTIEFEGGFEVNPLVSSDTSLNSWCAMWTPKLYDTLTKIRNNIVHVRERRQSKVILPSKANNKKLKRYIPLIRRASEQVAIFS